MTTPDQPKKGDPLFEDDPYGSIKRERSKGMSKRDVTELHRNSDKDSSIGAQHHTLGIKRNQASPGDHIHDGRSSRRVGQGLGLSVTGSRGGNAALASLIAQLQKVIDLDDNSTA